MMNTPIALFAWSSLAVVVVLGLLSWAAWHKMQKMREEIHRLAEAVTMLGSTFIREEIHQLKEDVHQLCADMRAVKERVGLSPPARDETSGTE